MTAPTLYTGFARTALHAATHRTACRAMAWARYGRRDGRRWAPRRVESMGFEPVLLDDALLAYDLTWSDFDTGEALTVRVFNFARAPEVVTPRRPDEGPAYPSGEDQREEARRLALQASGVQRCI